MRSSCRARPFDILPTRRRMRCVCTQRDNPGFSARFAGTLPMTIGARQETAWPQGGRLRWADCLQCPCFLRKSTNSRMRVAHSVCEFDTDAISCIIQVLFTRRLPRRQRYSRKREAPRKAR